MLLPTFFVVDFNNYDDLPEVQLPENTHICYKINYSSIHLIRSFYRKLFLAAKKYPFCVLIEMKDDLNKLGVGIDVIDFLVSISFHSQYIKTSYDNPLVLFEVNHPDADKYVSIVKETFKSHGYNDIETIMVNKENISLPEVGKKNIYFSLQKNHSSLSADYIDSIKKITSSGFSFFFFLEYPEELLEILNTIQKTDAMLQKDLPQIHSLLEENISLKLKEDELLSEIELLREQLDSLDNYHLNYNSSVTRYKKQITELLKFYRNEYEILPLWYKRFGHILKVLMGKRTLRSLFNDKVKKQKD